MKHSNLNLDISYEYGKRGITNLGFNDLITQRGNRYFNDIINRISCITIFISSFNFTNAHYWRKILNILLLELKRINIDNYIYIVDDVMQEILPSGDKRLSADGFLFIGETSPSIINLILEMEKPHIFVDCTAPAQSSTIVLADNYRSGYESAKMLFEHGHTRLCFLDAAFKFLSYRQRYEGFMKFVKEHENEVESVKHIIPDVKNMRDILDGGFMELMLRPDRPTGLFCATDFMLHIIRAALKQLNLSMPEDLSIISFDNIDIMALNNFGVNSFDVSKVNMAMTALYLLLVYIDEKKTSLPIDVFVETVLVDRGSVAFCTAKKGDTEYVKKINS